MEEKNIRSVPYWIRVPFNDKKQFDFQVYNISKFGQKPITRAVPGVCSRSYPEISINTDSTRNDYPEALYEREFSISKDTRSFFRLIHNFKSKWNQ